MARDVFLLRFQVVRSLLPFFMPMIYGKDDKIHPYSAILTLNGFVYVAGVFGPGAVAGDCSKLMVAIAIELSTIVKESG